MDFSKKLKALREQAHLSQKDLSERSKVSQQAISAIEKGDRSPTEASMDMLAQALGYSLIGLLSYGAEGKDEGEILSHEERELLRYFRMVNGESRKTILDLVSIYATNPAKQEGHTNQTAL